MLGLSACVDEGCVLTSSRGATERQQQQQQTEGSDRQQEGEGDGLFCWCHDGREVGLYLHFFF